MRDTSKLRKMLNLYWSERYGYPFDDWVADRLDRGVSYRQLERELDDLTNLGITHPTLIKWFPADGAKVAS